MSISIKNLRNEKPTKPWQIRVDRQSMFGNPYRMNSESERDAVCDEYEELFNNLITENVYAAEMDSILEIYRKYGKLELFCWCAPKRCHAETIRNYLLKIDNIK